MSVHVFALTTSKSTLFSSGDRTSNYCANRNGKKENEADAKNQVRYPKVCEYEGLQVLQKGRAADETVGTHGTKVEANGGGKHDSLPRRS